VIPHPDPVINRRRLRNELRRAREAADKSQQAVALAMDWSASKLIRIESGAVSVSTNDLRALLSFYGVPQSRVLELVDVARVARQPPRWGIYRNVATPEFIAYLGYESSATVIRNFEPLFVPGLLQTEEYARETILKMAERERRLEVPDEARIDALVDLRVERQEILTCEPRPNFHFIMDEAAVRRHVGGRRVMCRQLCHILELTAADNITIRVVPFKAGAYQRLWAAFVLLEFAEAEDEDVLVIEDPFGRSLIIREATTPERDGLTPENLLADFWELEQIAPAQDAPAILKDALAALAI
jgi:transcriptional regulator with XRE-family HTH domain